MVNNPFDLDNYKPKISMRDQNIAAKNSYQQTTVINRSRAKGVEPSIVYSKRGAEFAPAKFIVDMPSMPKGASQLRRDRSKARKQTGAETVPMNQTKLIAIAREVYGRETEWKGLVLQKLKLLAEKILEAERERVAEESNPDTGETE